MSNGASNAYNWHRQRKATGRLAVTAALEPWICLPRSSPRALQLHIDAQPSLLNVLVIRQASDVYTQLVPSQSPCDKQLAHIPAPIPTACADIHYPISKSFGAQRYLVLIRISFPIKASLAISWRENVIYSSGLD
jgi:hypothetical protein